ncbi:MAG: AAA family ATPase [Porticoccaceae bacterium]|nr:AAA family ATPase [Porticoccaceae bacterium]
MSVQEQFQQLQSHLDSQIVGQGHLTQRLLMALLANGHLLVEGAPGLAKTKAVKTLAEHIEGDFHRIQFTPDLLPADITGSDIYRPQDGSFQFQKGPLFHNLLLADEVNRAPAKVQSALLEAMAEHQVSVGSTTYALPDLFMVMATQNPIEQEGTYPLPEAQMDRFLLHVLVSYPSAESERQILQLSRQEASGQSAAPGVKVPQSAIFEARRQALAVHMAEPVEEYLVQLILASRDPSPYSEELAQWLDYGGSPRATIALDRCARVQAWLAGRDFVTPDDIRAVINDVLRHRLILSFEAEASGVTPDQVVDDLTRRVPSA